MPAACHTPWQWLTPRNPPNATLRPRCGCLIFSADIYIAVIQVASKHVVNNFNIPPPPDGPLSVTAMQDNTQPTMFTSFLLLCPKMKRPPIRSTELPAGNAFNNALRAMASRNGFVTQWFGWQHLSSMAAESAQSAERLIWMISKRQSSHFKC
jgi:hypothetical protein